MVNAKRMTGRMEGEFVVFLIGMRINRWWKFWKWLPVMFAMPRMIKELMTHPELGYLGGDFWFGRTIISVQYWRSTEQLMEYAKSRDRAHLPAWRAFNKAVGANGDVGIYHETYRVGPGQYESIYANMPAFGLGKVGQLVDATGAREHAKDRLKAA